MTRTVLDEILNLPAQVQPPSPFGGAVGHVNIIIPSLALGGAERCVLDVIEGLRRSGGTGLVFVLNRLKAEYQVEDDPSFPVISVAGLDPFDQMRAIAAHVLNSPTTVVLSHLVRTALLRTLWRYGLQTIPVVHNSALGWHEPIANFDDPNVPFVIAVSHDVKAQLSAAACAKPVCVLRHEVQRWKSVERHQQDRAEVRHRHGIGAETLLIGMVGQFKAHKAYVRAVRVLAALRAGRKARLMIVGGWDHAYGSGRQSHAATLDQARALDVLDDLILVGPSLEATKYISAFDVFLNTSIYEGLSIASLEAAQLGCPLVLSDVGGQREIASGPSRCLVAVPSDTAAYVRGIEALAGGEPAIPAAPPRLRHLVPQLWSLLAEQAMPRPGRPVVQSLFVTSNLNPGGAQRSLTNLLLSLGPRHPSWLCVVDRVLGDAFVDAIRKTDVGLSGVSQGANLVGRARDILTLARRLGVRSIVFWNLDPMLKLVVAKALEGCQTTLVDVSPGPMLFEELATTAALQQRIAFTVDDYMRRLDHFVSKYHGGLPPGGGDRPKRVHVIPNGVPVPPARQTTPPMVRPAEADPRFALVTCCRIVPAKRIETLVEIMTHLSVALPKASLTIIGGVDQRHLGYLDKMNDLIAKRGLDNIHFVGPHGDVFNFLDQFACFIMMSNSQGCPNASLEAMAMGLPVVANPDGGTVEQVLHGETGYLADPEDPAQVAAYAMTLLTNGELAWRMGQAGRERARRCFSIESMTASYRALLEGGPILAETERVEP